MATEAAAMKVLTKAQAAALDRRVQRLVVAEVDDTWKGGGDPDAIPDIERELKLARADFYRYLNRLTK